MKRTSILTLLIAVALGADAAPLIVENFDNIAIGTKWKMWERWGNSVSSTATVEADPKNPSNHVLHIRLKDWNTFPEFNVPTEYAGEKLAARFKSVRFRMLRSSNETDDYKQLHIYLGNDQMYADQSYPYQGDRNVWQERTYDIANISEGSSATALRLGLHHSSSDYYIDDVTLVGVYDDYVTYDSGELNICTKNTSSSYAVYTTPTFIPEGTTLNVYTSRYTDFNAPLAGTGTLNIHGGGERTYLGEHSNKKYPDWSLYSGDVHVYKYNNVEASAGFYGIVMAHNGKTFSPENIQDGILTGKVCSMLENNRVTIHNGAAMAFENGTRAARYGQLDTEAGSRIYGYYKATAGAGAYVIMGGNNADATLAGRIAPMESNGKPLNTCLIGLIKEGRGTYTLTANDNCISGAIRVIGGRVNICNDAFAAQKGKLTGGTGTPANNAAVAFAMNGGVIGGTGNIAGIVDIYGTLEPGTKVPGTLTIKDYATNAKAALRMHPEGKLRFKVKSADEYDQLYVNNDIELSNIKEDFTTSADMPRIKVVLADGYSLNVGDELTLLTAAKRLNADNWTWDIVFPSKLTWKTEERQLEDGRYALVLTVVSLDDDPANSGNDTDEDDNQGDNDSWDQTFGDDGDTHSIRYYADAANMRIGVAVPPSRIAIDNAQDASTKIITGEFNMLVPENELKFDWVEPSQNNFNYSDADRLYNLAKRNNMYMRGHTLAWHSQVAAWVSSDGKKNDKGWTKAQLMAILKNHIMNVVGHYKGKIGEWDVVNECLDDDQSVVRNNPEGYLLRRQSIWTTVCGEEFIDSAFVWAHRADPDAKLYLNDYGNEFMGNAKAQAFFNLAKRLKASGIPIDGVGFQCHLDAGLVDAKALGNNIERYAPLGLECTITELDMGISVNKDEARQQQARDYYRVVEAAMSQPHCRSVLVWGVSDNMSWRSSNPLLWNGAMERKPAYYAVRCAVKDAAGSESNSIDAPDVTDGQLVSTTYYTVSGMQVSSPLDNQITIIRKSYSNGHVETVKVAPHTFREQTH